MSVINNDKLQRIAEDSSTSCSCSWCERSRIRKKKTRRRSVSFHILIDDEQEGIEVQRKQKQHQTQPQQKQHMIDLPTIKPIDSNQNSNDVALRGYNFNCRKAFCFHSFFDMFKAKKQEEQDLSTLNNDTNDKNSIDSNVPSIIILEQKVSSMKIDDGDSSSMKSSNQTRQKILQTAGSMFSMFDRDLKTRTTTTASTSIENSMQVMGSTQNITQNISNDTTTLSDNDYDKDYLIARTVSSISNPNFDDCSSHHIDDYEDDPLHILNVKDDLLNAINEQLVETDQSTKCRQTFEKRFQLSGNLCQECREESEVSRELDVLIKDSLLSFDNVNLDIVDGISYENEEDAVLLDLESYEGIKKHQFSDEDKADLDNLCEESIQSNSVKSFSTAPEFDDIKN